MNNLKNKPNTAMIYRAMSEGNKTCADLARYMKGKR